MFSTHKYKYFFMGLTTIVVVTMIWLRDDHGIAYNSRNQIYKTFNHPDICEVHNEFEFGNWIDIFPELKAMQKNMSEKRLGNLFKSTSAKNTQLNIPNIIYKLGDNLKATLIAKDYEDTQKTYGGDYFRAILRPVGKTKDGISCTIEDKMNGIYLIQCLLIWSGDSELHVYLLHPSESVMFLMLNTTDSNGGVRYKTNFINSKKMKESSVCALDFGNEYSLPQLCNYSHPRNGEPWYCVKPLSGECNDIVWQVEDVREVQVIPNVKNNPFYDTNTNWNIRIDNGSRRIHVINNNVTWNETKRLPCKEMHEHNLNPSVPTGFIQNGEWKSLVCNNSEYNKQTMLKCLTNKSVYFIGDSTIRTWYEFYLKELKAKETLVQIPNSWSSPRRAVSEKHNITLHYKSHGPPLRNPGPPISRPYVTDTLENIPNSGDKNVIFFSIGFHFQVFTPQVVMRRIKVIKKGFVDIQKRLPGIQIFVKGFHTHTETKAVIASDWLSYRFEVILRHEFGEMKDVTYLSMWDAAAVIENPLIHPTGKEEILFSGIFQSFLCSS
uniref:NXPE family member 3-like n=1 Tax=Styela clava TaxID=7725 RepID=UPI00193ABFF0|nr:NXPE family member 3-like [Styela clava]